MKPVFKIQDEKNVYNKVTRPTVVFDKEDGVLLKIGEYDTMRNYYDQIHGVYTQAGLHDIANELVLMELPKDQEIIDKVFNIAGYIKRVYKQTMKVKEQNHDIH